MPTMWSPTSLRVPLLFIHTANDTITPTEQSIRMFEQAGSAVGACPNHRHIAFPRSRAGRTALPRRSSRMWLDKFIPSPLGMR